jgi:hypothetical protein
MGKTGKETHEKCYDKDKHHQSTEEWYLIQHSGTRKASFLESCLNINFVGKKNRAKPEKRRNLGGQGRGRSKSVLSRRNHNSRDGDNNK